MNELGFDGEKSTKDDLEVLGLSDQGQVCLNQKLGGQEKILICWVSDMMDLKCETLAVPGAWQAGKK